MILKFDSGHLTEQGAREVHVLRGQGFTYRKIAARLDITEGTVARILKGRTWPELAST